MISTRKAKALKIFSAILPGRTKMELLKHYKTIFSRELKSYFYSPIAYIVISIFLVVTGWFFYSTFFLYNQAELRNFFQLLPIIFSFIIPAVTMKLFSEELNLGSYEIIATMPVTFLDIIAGKFLAAFAFLKFVTSCSRFFKTTSSFTPFSSSRFSFFLFDSSSL